MVVSITEAKRQLAKLVRAVETGETAVITRNDKAVAALGPPPKRRGIKWGALKGKIKLLPGWDDPVTPEELLGRRW